MAERAGYTVTMFIVDVSKSMGDLKSIEAPDRATKEITSLEWGLQFVKLKIQEMIFNGRKTDQCGVILSGSAETKNAINSSAQGGYENVYEYIPIAQPSARTLAKLDRLEPSDMAGDIMDALIVTIETQNKYLGKKKTWTRKIVLITDAEGPINMDSWEETADKMNELNVSLTIVGVDFDDPNLPYKGENKSRFKAQNEEDLAKLTDRLYSGVVGNCAYALQEISCPDVKVVKSVLSGTVLTVGDIMGQPEQAIEISVKTSKCTALARPKGWKKFAQRIKKKKKEDGGEEEEEEEEDPNAMQVDPANAKIDFTYLKQTSIHFIEPEKKEEEDQEELMQDITAPSDADKTKKEEEGVRIHAEDLVRGFKYGTTYVPCPDGQFPRLNTKKGISICGFFKREHFRRELCMSEVQYVWGDPASSAHQVAVSSLVQAMKADDLFAIARWVTKDGSDVKMGLLAPVEFENVDCFLWTQMPFADDVRRYNFQPLEKLVNKKGEVITEHPYKPTKSQMASMETFVDAMDIMDAGKDEEGNLQPWFDCRLSYNPAIHRIKQAMFHCAISSDVAANPCPPPHPALFEYFDPPRRVLKRCRNVIGQCMKEFNVIEVPKKAPRARKLEHVHAQDEDDEPLLLGDSDIAEKPQDTMMAEVADKSEAADDDSATEDESDEELLLEKKKTTPLKKQPPLNHRRGAHLPTPGLSPSPELDAGREPGRIIGVAFPLKDFKENLEEGDIVTKAVEDMAFVIRDILKKPFSSRRTDELLECMQALRETSLKEDEIDAWNKFLRDLKKDCSKSGGNKQFWIEVQKMGRGLSLISDSEASALGGESNVSEKKAEEFVS